MYDWDDVLEKGEYEGLTVYEVFMENPYYLRFIERHKGAVFTEEVSASIDVRIMIEEKFGNAEEDHGQGTFEALETSSASSLGEQVRDMWQSASGTDRVSSHNTTGEEVDALGLEERNGSLW